MCPLLYRDEATPLVFDIDQPRVEFAVCSMVSVVKGGFGFRLIMPSLASISNNLFAEFIAPTVFSASLVSEVLFG